MPISVNMLKKEIPRIYKTRSLSVSGKTKNPDDDIVAQNLWYECRMLMQRSINPSRTCRGELAGISFATTKAHIILTLLNAKLGAKRNRKETQ